MKKYLFLGGVFNDEGGRSSSYIRKLTDFLQQDLTGNWVVLNGGFFENLNDTIENEIKNFDCVFWFCDVPNDKPKLVKFIKEKHPEISLIISKNNRSNNYTHEMLVERIKKAQATYLLEFKNTINNSISATLLNIHGDCVFREIDEIEQVSNLLIQELK